MTLHYYHTTIRFELQITIYLSDTIRFYQRFCHQHLEPFLTNQILSEPIRGYQMLAEAIRHSHTMGVSSDWMVLSLPGLFSSRKGKAGRRREANPNGDQWKTPSERMFTITTSLIHQVSVIISKSVFCR